MTARSQSPPTRRSSHNKKAHASGIPKTRSHLTRGPASVKKQNPTSNPTQPDISRKKKGKSRANRTIPVKIEDTHISLVYYASPLSTRLLGTGNPFQNNLNVESDHSLTHAQKSTLPHPFHREIKQIITHGPVRTDRVVGNRATWEGWEGEGWQIDVTVEI